MPNLRRALLGVVLGAILTTPSASNAAAPFQYLVDAANQIAQIQYSKTVLSQDDNGRIAKIACDAMNKLVDDPDFKRALADILSPERLKFAQSPAFALVGNLKEFNEVFLRSELANLRKAGLEYPAAFASLQVASHERLRTNLKEVSSKSVMHDVEIGRDAVCRMAAQIASERERKAALWVFGGATLVVADAAAAIGIAAVSGGTGTPAAAAVAITSIALGANAAIAGAKGDVP